MRVENCYICGSSMTTGSITSANDCWCSNPRCPLHCGYLSVQLHNAIAYLINNSIALKEFHLYTPRSGSRTPPLSLYQHFWAAVDNFMITKDETILIRKPQKHTDEYPLYPESLTPEEPSIYKLEPKEDLDRPKVIFGKYTRDKTYDTQLKS